MPKDPKVYPDPTNTKDEEASVTAARQVAPSIEDKKKAKSRLYGILFHNWMAKAAILPSLYCGAIPILLYLVFGEMINILADTKLTVDEKADKCLFFVLYYGLIAIGASIGRFFDNFFWLRCGSQVSVELRSLLFKSMMRSEVTFFDVNPIGGILTLLAEDSTLVQDAFGITKGTQLQNVAQFLTGIILAFIYSWRQALVALAAIPVILAFAIIFIPKVSKFSVSKFQHTSASLTIAEETIGAIRTIKGFNAEEFETNRLRHESLLASKDEIKISILMTLMMSGIMLFLWGDVIGNLYYGGTLVVQDKLNVGDIFSVFGFTMFGCMGILMMQGSMQSEQKAIVAGARIIKLTEHIPEVPFDGGETPATFAGKIEFKNVSFKYPTRDVYVLRNVSFKVMPGQMSALVGHSGSGKSTCVQLLERYYDVSEGVILLDDKDIKVYDPRWLHRKIGLVSQEPVLFQLTIKQNILYGVENKSEEEVIEAATTANASKFISKLEKGYDEMVGEKGGSLSGGQRQRIAIARAVIKNPVILITDEATSALDAESEKKVQIALDKVMEGRTAVVVAHRLSTIRNADIIYVFEGGEIKEEGKHEDLVQKRGFYYNLVYRQLADHELKEIEKPVAQENNTSSSDLSAPKSENDVPNYIDEDYSNDQQ